ncbi:CoA-transferase family III domain-containing protein [Mucidula mucida]|nr:CoA-transferase family III domain-containing protein [Mucidula mucida]
MYSVPATSRVILDSLLKDDRLSLPSEVVAFANDVVYSGNDLPYLPVPFKFTEAIAALKGLEASFAAALAERRFGPSVRAGKVEINTDHAALFVFSAFTVTVNGKPALTEFVPKLRDWDIHDSLKLVTVGRWPRILSNQRWSLFPSPWELERGPDTKDGWVDPTRIDITDEAQIQAVYAEVVAKFDAETIQTLANDTHHQAGVICYRDEELENVEQAQAIKNCPIYELHQPDSPTEPCPWPRATSNRCLSGIKVLEFTRIIAAPAIGRSLAENGATVLRITSPNNPDFHSLNVDLSCGKLNAFLDLKTDAGKARCRELIADADVIIDGYRPGCLERLGFGKDAVNAMISHRQNRGIVYVRENTYGFHGPWKHRSGWQQIADCFTGVSWTFGRKLGLDEPVVPIFPNADFGTGAIGNIAVMHALYLRSIQASGRVIWRGCFALVLRYWLKTLGLYSEEVWQAIRPDVPIRHDWDMLMMLRAVLPKMIKDRPDVFANADFWQLIDAPSYGGVVRVPKAVIRYSGGLELGYERPPTQNGEDPAEWP